MNSNFIEIVSIILAIVCFLGALAVGLLTPILRESSTSKRVHSYSRFQFWIWTLIIPPIATLKWGFNYPGKFELNETCLILLGISSAVGLTSGIVSHARKGDGTQEVAMKSSSQKEGFLISLLMDDNEQFSITRLQNLIFTFLYVVIFIVTFFSGGMKAIPEFGPMTYTLIGISGGTYVMAKGIGK